MSPTSPSNRPAGPAPAPVQERRAWRFTCVVAATFFHFVSLYCLLPTLPLYLLDLGGSTFEVGLVIGILALTSLLARPFLGAWMDRVGRRGFLVAGAGVYVAASLGYAAIRSVTGLLLWRAFHGLGLAAFSTAATSLAADLAPPGRRGATMGAFGVAQAAALAVGPGIGLGVATGVGYPGLFGVSAGLALVALACAIALPAGGPQFGSAVSARPRASARRLWGLTGAPAAIQLAASVAYGAIISFVAVVARERGLEGVGGFFALLALSSLGARLTAGKAYDARGAAFVLIPLLGTLAAGMALVAVGTGPASFLWAAVLSGLGIGGTHTVLVSAVVDRAPPERRARNVAGFAACWELGVGAGTILIGRLAEAAGFQVMFLVVAALSVVALAALPWLGEGEEPAS